MFFFKKKKKERGFLAVFFFTPQKTLIDDFDTFFNFFWLLMSNLAKERVLVKKSHFVFQISFICDFEKKDRVQKLEFLRGIFIQGFFMVLKKIWG